MGIYIAADDGISGLEVGSEGRGVSRGAATGRGYIYIMYVEVAHLYPLIFQMWVFAWSWEFLEQYALVNKKCQTSTGVLFSVISE